MQLGSTLGGNMSKYILTLAFVALSAAAWAGTTISTTLTLTSPSAYISMTGVSATAYVTSLSATRVVSALQVSATNVSATNVSATTITNRGVAKAWATFGGLSACSISSSLNISSCTKLGGTGNYSVSFTTPMNTSTYVIQCTTWLNVWASFLNTGPAPDVNGFAVNTRGTAAASNVDPGYIHCIVFE